MKHILITGSMGFIGAYAAKILASKYHCIGVDIRPGDPGHFAANFRADIRDDKAIGKIFSAYPVECVIHAAAEKSLVRCEEDFARARSINYDATLALAEITKKHGGRFVFISSDQVFGGKGSLYKENDKVSPINCYGRLKVMAENALAGDSAITICRTALVFGPVPANQRASLKTACGRGELQVQGYIVQHVRHRLMRGQNIRLPADEFVTPTHVDLLARQLRKIIDLDACGILHCCGAERVSRHEFGRRIAQKYALPDAGIISTPGCDPLRPKDVSLDCRHSENILGMSFDTLDEMLNLPL